MRVALCISASSKQLYHLYTTWTQREMCFYTCSVFKYQCIIRIYRHMEISRTYIFQAERTLAYTIKLVWCILK